MLTPEQLKEIPESFVQQVQELEDYIIAGIARRVGREGELTAAAVLQLDKALELGADIREIERLIQKTTGAVLEDIDRTIREAVKESVDADNAIYKAAGYDPVDFQRSPELMDLLEAGIRQTQREFQNLTASLGFASMQGGGLVFQNVASFYHSTLNMAAMQVTTDVLDLNSAKRYAVKKMADSGLRYVEYASGHVNRADVAVRRAILTGVNQLNLRLTDSIMETLGAEYVEVTAHPGARPDHKAWQGQVYHVGGEKDGYPDFESSTGYGTGPGLGGWNCRHSYFPYFPGISARAYTDEQLRNMDNPPFTYNGKRYTHYEASQKQRQMETGMRRTKRELVAYDAAGLEDDFTAASIRLAAQKQEYQKFSRAAGLRAKLERAEQYGFDRSIGQKAAWARRPAMERVSAPTIKDTVFAKEGKSFQALLQQSTGEAKHVRRMRLYAETTEYAENQNLKAPFTYNPEKDIIEYNTKHPNFDRYDPSFAQAHELSHRMDILEYGAYKNPTFGEAIEEAKAYVREHREELQKLFAEGGKYYNDFAFSDIISALSDNAIFVLAGHDSWNNEKARLEIFANLSAIDVLGLESAKEPVLRKLLAVYRKMVA